MTHKQSSPTPELAATVVETHLGWRPEKVVRFPTGAAHFVYDAVAADGQAVVVRMGMPDRHAPMAKGQRLMQRLSDLLQLFR